MSDIMNVLVLLALQGTPILSIMHVFHLQIVSGSLMLCSSGGNSSVQSFVMLSLLPITCFKLHLVSRMRMLMHAIRSASLHTTGGAGPSGLDATAWHLLCYYFKSASTYVFLLTEIMGYTFPAWTFV